MNTRRNWFVRIWTMCLPALVVLLAAHVAGAAVKREGTWPESDATVSLDFAGPRAQAVVKLADAAGWSLVVQSPLESDGGDVVKLHVVKQPASKVLDLVLDDTTGSWIASRDGTLVSLRRAAEPQAAPAAATPPPSAAPSPVPPPPAAAPAPPPPPPPPAPSTVTTKPRKHGAHGEDRVITGGKLVVGKDETVHDIAVIGGKLDVFGTVTGDIAVTGGSVVIHKGAHVHGDVGGFGGSATIEDGAEVDGDVGFTGGAVHRGDKTQSGGAHVDVDPKDEDDDASSEENKVGPKLKPLRETVRDIGSAITRSAFLFSFGAILLALGTRRMESLRAEIAARPMRSFAIGAVALLGGSLALVVLCVTVIGIPVAFVGLLAAVFGGYAGVVAVLTTVGEALLRHKTENTYVHLAVGCGLFLVAGSLPFIGPFVTAAVALCGLGVFVATRAAGYWPEKRNPNAGPYRTAG